MATKWIKTTFPGVRYREHPERRHGVKWDQYFVIRFKLDGKDVEESIGWASEGHTASQAFETLAQLKRNIKSGTGPRTLAEKRSLADVARQEAEADRLEAERVKALEVKERIPFADIWKEYLAQAQADRGAAALKREESLFKLWIKPTIGKRPLREVAPIHLERIKTDMAKGGRAPRTIHYALAVIRQVFNYARRNGYFDSESPTSRVKKPKVDNRRLRFLTREEAARLLDKLAETSQDVHDMALLSLHTGMRAGEIFSLTWQDVDTGRGILTLRNTKNGRTRPAFLTPQASAMLEARRGHPRPTDLVFPPTGNRKGDRIKNISDTFPEAVEALGLNQGVDDPRHRITFHSLRHTYASWQVERGVDLFTVKELLGHQTLAMTSRYAHLAPSTLQAAAAGLGAALAGQDETTGKVLDFNKAANQ
jgi:integrase